MALLRKEEWGNVGGGGEDVKRDVQTRPGRTERPASMGQEGDGRLVDAVC